MSCSRSPSYFSPPTSDSHHTSDIRLRTSSILHQPSSICHLTSIERRMSEISNSIQAKCLAFGDRIIKLNDYLLSQAASRMSDGRSKKSDVSKGKSAFSHQTSAISQPSSFKHHTLRVPVYLQSVAVLCNQLLRSGTSIGANNAEPTHERVKSQACLSFAEREGGRRQSSL